MEGVCTDVRRCPLPRPSRTPLHPPTWQAVSSGESLQSCRQTRFCTHGPSARQLVSADWQFCSRQAPTFAASAACAAPPGDSSSAVAASAAPAPAARCSRLTAGPACSCCCSPPSAGGRGCNDAVQGRGPRRCRLCRCLRAAPPTLAAAAAGVAQACRARTAWREIAAQQARPHGAAGKSHNQPSPTTRHLHRGQLHRRAWAAWRCRAGDSGLDGCTSKSVYRAERRPVDVEGIPRTQHTRCLAVSSCPDVDALGIAARMGGESGARRPVCCARTLLTALGAQFSALQGLSLGPAVYVTPRLRYIEQTCLLGGSLLWRT